MTLSKVVVVEVVRKEWIMYIFLKVEQIRFADRIGGRCEGKRRR